MANSESFWIRWRVRAGYPVALAFLLLAKPTQASLLAGAVVGSLGLAIRAWAAGYLRKHEALATQGPYAMTRNPLYFGSAILAVGLMIAGNSIWAGALVAAYILVFYPAVMRREEAELRGHYGKEFAAYAARVPLFWPRIGNSKRHEGPPARFSVQLYSRNREYQAAIGFVLGLAVLWVKMKWMK